MADHSIEERKFLHEFSLKSCKFATEMSDLTKEEICLWRKFLKQEQLIHNNVIDLFDNIEDIRIIYFGWKHDNKIDLLLDMKAWPGDNESGTIYFNGKIVIKGLWCYQQLQHN